MDQKIINLKQWMEKGYAPPEEVQIYPTNKCNLKCVFCCQALNQYNLNDELSKQRWLEIAEELCSLGVKKILISGGGEPLMVPEATVGMMKVFKSKGLHGRLINNGVLWTENLIADVIEIQWDTVMFSIDGPNAQIHDRLRGVEGCFDKIIHNIKIFNRIKKSKTSNKPRLEINFVLNKLNYKEIGKMVQLAKELEIDFLNFEPICLNNPEVSKLRLTEDERTYFMGQILPYVEKLSNGLEVRTNLDRLFEVKVIEKAGELDEKVFSDLKTKKNSEVKFLDAICFEPWLWPKIEANGEVWPCSTAPLKTNIKDESFRDIWYGKEFKKFRGKILKGELSESCKNCVMTHLSINKEIRENLKEVL